MEGEAGAGGGGGVGGEKVLQSTTARGGRYKGRYNRDIHRVQ